MTDRPPAEKLEAAAAALRRQNRRGVAAWLEDQASWVGLPCGCGDFALRSPTPYPDDFSVRCPECGDWFGQGADPGEDDDEEPGDGEGSE